MRPVKKEIIALLAAAPLIATPGVALASTVSTPAPAGKAQGQAADVAGVVGVGETSAQADQDSASSDANAVTLGGQTVSGGSAKADSSHPTGSDSGSLIGTGEQPFGDIEVAPYDAKATYSADKRTADSSAALAHIILGDSSTLDVTVLGSQSHATHDGATSTGRTSADGADVEAGGGSQNGGLSLILLHSEADSSGKGSSYVANINDNQILTNSDANGQCVLAVPQLVTLSCLSASGGTGTNGVQQAAADVGQIDFAPDQLPDGTVVGSQAQGQPTAAPQVEGESHARPPAQEPQAQPQAQPQGGALPFTGSNVAGLGLYGGLLTALGAAAVWAQRRFGRSTA